MMRKDCSDMCIRLNIGSGGKRMAGFVSVDKYSDNADVIADCDNTGYGENTVNEIYTSHMVEHINLDHFVNALEHWHYVLKPNATLTIRCPNGAVYVREFLTLHEKNDYSMLGTWGTRNLLGWEGYGTGMLNRQLFTRDYLFNVVNSVMKVISCIETETRVKNPSHIEYRHNGDLLLKAVNGF